AGACVLSDGQSFSSGGRDAPGQFGAGHEMVSGHLYQPFQSAAQTVWPSVQRTLQVVDRGRQQQWVFADGVRLRAFESGAGEVAFSGAAVAGVSVEQLAGIFEVAGQAGELVAGGT